MKYISILALFILIVAFTAFKLTQHKPGTHVHDAHHSGEAHEHLTGALPGSEHQLSNSTDNHDGHHHHHDIETEKLQALIDKHVSPEMRQSINQTLQPNGRPPEIYQHNGHWVVDTSDRAGSVMIAIIDEEEGLVVTDFMQPIPEQAEGHKQAAQMDTHQ